LFIPLLLWQGEVGEGEGRGRGRRPSRNKVPPLFLPDGYVASLERRPTVWKGREEEEEEEEEEERKKAKEDKKRRSDGRRQPVCRCSCPMPETMPTSLQPRFDQVEGASGMRG